MLISKKNACAPKAPQSSIKSPQHPQWYLPQNTVISPKALQASGGF